MPLTQIIGPVSSVQSDKRLISGCAPKMNLSTSIGGVLLGIDPQPTLSRQPDQRTARQRHRGQTNVNEGGAFMCMVGCWRDQNYSSWGDLSSLCNTILRCRMNKRQRSLISYSSSANDKHFNN